MYSESLLKRFGEGKVKVGDSVKLSSKLGEFEGILMPRPEVGDNNIIVIKQKDGYNVGVRFTSEMRIEKTGSATEKFDFPKKSVGRRPGLPKVTMLYTGGTIGSKIDYMSGGVHVLTDPAELLYDTPELEDVAQIEVKDVMHIFSENIIYKDWQLLAEEAAAAFGNGARGVVIATGTDTMHYTSAAISFMLGRVRGPVVITGAQRSSDRGSSDAFMNLSAAVRIAAQSDIAEVGICMHDGSSDKACSFISGTKARKMHTSRRDAFRPINDTAIARVSHDGSIEYLRERRKVGEKGAKPMTGFEPKIALVKSYPDADPGVIDYYVHKGYKGFILEGTGLGHLPTPEEKQYSWHDAIKNAIAKGIVCGMTSQCINGRVNGNVYSSGRLLLNLGVIYCEDMLPEVAYVKLGWLLGNYKKDDAAKMLGKNLIGEIKERTTYDEF